MRRALRILSISLITAGLVMLADVGLTLVWTEPVSALYGEIRQSQAEGNLEDLTQELAAEGPGTGGDGALSPAEARRAARDFAGRIEQGDAIGRISIDRTKTDLVFVEGTGTADLRVGPGRYGGTALPGQGRTVAIAGHRTTYGAPFHDIDELRRGDEIVLKMPYGSFTYEVTGHEIVTPNETEVLDDTGREQVVLTTCHPLYSAAERYVVSARLESFRA